jgi:hypothetical protein
VSGAKHKGTAQIAREVIAEALKANKKLDHGRTGVSPDLTIKLLWEGFKQIDPSLFVALDSDDENQVSGLILANDRASAYAAINITRHAMRINREALSKSEIVIPLMMENPQEQLIWALASVIEDFSFWSIGDARRNGRVRS